MQTKTIGFALLIALAQPINAQEVESIRGDESTATPRSAKPRPQSEAEFYTAAYGLSVTEAEQRLKVVEALGNEVANLRTEFKARLAGIYLDHLPGQRIVVRLTGKTPVPTRQAINKEGSIPIVFVTGASATFKELEAVLAAHEDTLFSKIPALQGLYADERTGDIVLVVHATAAESKAYEAEAPSLS